MAKKPTRQWFQEKLAKFKDDPEFLREYIRLLEDELNAEKLNPKVRCNACGTIQPDVLIERQNRITCAWCGFSIGL